jgi:hypothetical protein
VAVVAGIEVRVRGAVLGGLASAVTIEEVRAVAGRVVGCRLGHGWTVGRAGWATWRQVRKKHATSEEHGGWQARSTAGGRRGAWQVAGEEHGGQARSTAST